jgi:hypothetical protein
MLKRIIKRIRIERAIARLIGPVYALSIVAIITDEWFRHWLRCRAVNRAIREVCHG